MIKDNKSFSLTKVQEDFIYRISLINKIKIEDIITKENLNSLSHKKTKSLRKNKIYK